MIGNVKEVGQIFWVRGNKRFLLGLKKFLGHSRNDYMCFSCGKGLKGLSSLLLLQLIKVHADDSIKPSSPQMQWLQPSKKGMFGSHFC